MANIGACTAIRIEAPLKRARTPSLFTVETSILAKDDSMAEPFAAWTRVLITSIGVTTLHHPSLQHTQERRGHARAATGCEETS